MLGLLTVAVSAAAVFLARRATKGQADGVVVAVDAGAYSRAQEIYESAIETLKSQTKQLHNEILDLQGEVNRLRAQSTDMQIEVSRLRMVNEDLSGEITRLKVDLRAAGTPPAEITNRAPY